MADKMMHGGEGAAAALPQVALLLLPLLLLVAAGPAFSSESRARLLRWVCAALC